MEWRSTRIHRVARPRNEAGKQNDRMLMAEFVERSHVYRLPNFFGGLTVGVIVVWLFWQIAG